MRFNIEEVNQLIRHRRSVFPRDYSGEIVDDVIVTQMLENANWAPNHKMTEPWRFMVFTRDGLRKLGEFQAACYKRVAEAKGNYSLDRHQALLITPLKSSHIISVGMKRDELKRLPEIEEAGAVYCAVENMYLTATAYGIGCYLSSGGITYFEEAKEFFELGPEDKLLGFMHIGVPMREAPDGRRKAINEKVSWVR